MDQDPTRDRIRNVDPNNWNKKVFFVGPDQRKRKGETKQNQGENRQGEISSEIREIAAKSGEIQRCVQNQPGGKEWGSRYFVFLYTSFIRSEGCLSFYNS